MAKRPTWSDLGTFMAVVVALALAQGGCGKDDSSSDHSHPTTTASGATTSEGINGRPSIGADAGDDASYPKALPHTGDVSGWVKTRAIRVVAAEKVGDLIHQADVVSTVKAFRVTSVASCRYNQQITSAEVLFIQASTPADAFGLMSVLVPDDVQTIAGDRSIRAVHMGNAVMRMAAQQGDVCVVMDVAGRVDLDSIQQSSRRLMDSIIFSLPAADLPLMMQVVANPQQSSARVWLVRDLATLAKIEHPLVRRVPTNSANRMLGLSADTTLSIAAVPASDKAPACLIWLAEYPTPAAAKAAHGRCTAASQPAGSSRGLHLTVLEPKGSRLAGAWTEHAGSTIPPLTSLQVALPR